MNEDGRGRFSGVSQFAIGPSLEVIRERDRRELLGAAGFFGVFTLSDAAFSFAPPAGGADGAVFFGFAGEGATVAARFLPAASARDWTGRAEAFFPPRARAAAFLAVAGFGAGFFAVTFLGRTFLPADFGRTFFADATLLVTALAEEAAFLTSFLTAEVARRRAGLAATALLPAFDGRFAGLGAAARFFAPEGLAELERRLGTGLRDEAFFFDFNCLAEADAIFLFPEA